MYLPNHYKCSSCHEEFYFAIRTVCYYTGTVPLGKTVADADLLAIPARPAWCKHCEALCIAEDIAPLRAFEDAYGAVRCGRTVEYPLYSEYWDPADVQQEIANLLRWRMGRIHQARTLCCGRSNFQFMDVAQPLLKHEGCEYGFIEPMIVVQSHCGPGPGVKSAANFYVYDPEGVLIGKLTWRNQDEVSWKVEPAMFAPIVEE
jgi:hypothetical protein